MSSLYTSLKRADEMTGQFFEPDTLQYVCNTCGATVIADKSAALTLCGFCGSEKIVTTSFDDSKRPDSIVPFKYGRNEAIEAFFEWCKAGRFSPIGFVNDFNLEKLTGIYVPFCLFDCDTDMDITANASTVSYITTGGRKNNQTTKTSSFYKLVRKRKLRWENIPVSRFSRVDDMIMDAIEPYDYSAVEGFDMKYLAGFVAGKYDQPPEVLEERLKVRLNKQLELFFQRLTEKYTFVTEVVDKSVHHKPEAHNALLPVWILNYEYLGKTYTFAMNGQTGKIAGKPPVSILKLILLGLALLPIFVVVCGFICGLIMGGL